MLDPVIPMEPVLSERIPQESNWMAQIKWDGVRILTYIESGSVRLFNRKKRERTMQFPELLDPASFCRADSAILDGEVIALGRDGKPAFHQVMKRDAITRLDRVSQVAKTVPITYMIFDVIYLNETWIHTLPFIERIQILADIIKAQPNIKLVESHTNGSALFRVIKEHGMEGIVAKEKTSPYLIGAKKHWLKIKNYQDLIAVVGGFTLNNGVVNAILLGLYDEENRLWYIGHTGTGKLSQKEWGQLTEVLLPLITKTIPFANTPDRQKDTHWVQPRITVKIKYAEWTEGMFLRQPSIQAFVDVPPEECLLDKKVPNSTTLS